MKTLLVGGGGVRLTAIQCPVKNIFHLMKKLKQSIKVQGNANNNCSFKNMEKGKSGNGLIVRVTNTTHITYRE